MSQHELVELNPGLDKVYFGGKLHPCVFLTLKRCSFGAVEGFCVLAAVPSFWCVVLGDKHNLKGRKVSGTRSWLRIVDLVYRDGAQRAVCVRECLISQPV